MENTREAAEAKKATLGRQRKEMKGKERKGEKEEERKRKGEEGRYQKRREEAMWRTVVVCRGPRRGGDLSSHPPLKDRSRR